MRTALLLTPQDGQTIDNEVTENLPCINSLRNSSDSMSSLTGGLSLVGSGTPSNSRTVRNEHLTNQGHGFFALSLCDKGCDFCFEVVVVSLMGNYHLCPGVLERPEIPSQGLAGAVVIKDNSARRNRFDDELQTPGFQRVQILENIVPVAERVSFLRVCNANYLPGLVEEGLGKDHSGQDCVAEYFSLASFVKNNQIVARRTHEPSR